MIRALIVYLFLLIGLRLTGKRELGQMTPFDIVIILLVANSVQNAMIGIDTSVIGGLIAAGTLITINYVVAQLRERIHWFDKAVEGSPALLIHEGEFVKGELSRQGLNTEDVMMAIREHGLSTLAQVKMAVLETDGSISIVPADAGVLKTRRHFRFTRK